MYPNYLKPIFDFFASLIGFLLLVPIFVIVTILLFFANNGKPFFIQPRPGKNGKTFKIIKFKTMNDRKDENGKLLSDEIRLTRVGAMVRKTSLDEMPQLLNVIMGDMSIIGPRPLLTDYLHLYDNFQNRRHEIKPGITGWAQVNGRNAISWDKKFEYDVWYVDHLSFLVDIKIIFKTIKKVLKSEGINAVNSISVEPFNVSKGVVLFGASGHCKVIIDILENSKTDINNIIDDNENIKKILNRKVTVSNSYEFNNSDNLIIAIGNNRIRKKLALRFKTNFYIAIHPKSIISRFTNIAEGTVIMAGVVINPDVIIGKHCIINTGAVIEHDCIIDDFAHICPNVSLAGGVKIGEGSQIGIGAKIIQGVKIGKWVIVGAGSVILNDILDYQIVVGNPGKFIKFNDNHDEPQI